MTNAKTTTLLSLVALLATAPAAASGRDDVGTVDRLEVNGLTRRQAALWVRATLPRVPPGSKQFFTGGITVSNVSVPIKQPATVMVQQRPGRNEAVFYVDLDLERVPQDLLPNFGPTAIALEVQGTLKGDKGSEAPVFAVGVLRLATADVTAPATFASTFVRYLGGGLTGFSLAETSGEARVALYNPLAFELVVTTVEYTVYAGGRTLASGTIRDVKLPGRKETTVALPLKARNTDLAAVMGSAALSGGSVDGRLVGRVVVRSGNGTLAVPVDVSGPLDVAR